MNSVCIRTLQLDDARRLLQFELDNRDWFERHIASRGDAFYSLDGVRDHILEFLAAKSAGRSHPCLLLSADDAVIGRVNLKNIDTFTQTAEVGYRIAESHVGKGLAKLAVRHLIDLARGQWQLKRLVADVAVNNTASLRVLEKCGFSLDPFSINRTVGSAIGHRLFLDVGPAQ